jgi:acetate kinase
MKTLVLNCGSSSLKFQLFEVEKETVIAKGVVEKIGHSDAILTYAPTGMDKIVTTRDIEDHDCALKLVFDSLMHPRNGVIVEREEIGGIGHRVVHGGEAFTEPVLIDDEVKDGIEKCIQFAPLHNPHNLKGIQVCERILPGIPQVAVFDTAFHHSMPARSYMYALPMALYRKLRIRRYGFHGTSHGFVANQAAEAIGRPLDELLMITCHLGNGCSMAAIDHGRSIDTSMGFTPLEGLVMGTRCGDIDPALVSFIAAQEGLTLAKVDNLMNKSSGMLGLTETTNDLREILYEAEQGSDQHALALDIFCHRIKKYIGAYAAVLGGLDAVVFTGGIGEKSSHVRSEVLGSLSFLGVEIDEERNEANEVTISTGSVDVLVVPTNEELAIARHTRQILGVLEEELEKSIPEEEISEELSQITGDDRAELLALWVANPRMGVWDLAGKLGRRIGRQLSVQAVQRELETLGLDRVSDEKLSQLVERAN